LSTTPEIVVRASLAMSEDTGRRSFRWISGVGGLVALCLSPIRARAADGPPVVTTSPSASPGPDPVRAPATPGDYQLPSRATSADLPAGCAQTWVDGKATTLKNAQCVIKPVSDATLGAAQALSRSMEFSGELPEELPENQMVRVDVQAAGYEDAHVFVPVRRGGAGDCCRRPVLVHATMPRRANLRLVVSGDSAAATGYAWARVAGREEQVDRCRVDLAAGVPSCDLYVPSAADGEVVATLNVVGTLNVVVPVRLVVNAREGALTEVRVHAPRTKYAVGTVMGLGVTLAGGFALGAIGAGAIGEPNDKVGFEAGGAVLTALAFGAAYFWMTHESDVSATVEQRRIRADGTEIDKAPVVVPAFSLTLPRSTRATVSSSPPRALFRW
jgi:hypothetical protein